MKGFEQFAISLSIRGVGFTNTVSSKRLAIAIKPEQRHLGIFNLNSAEQITYLHNNICSSYGFGENDMPRWRTVTFEDISIADFHSKIDRASAHLDCKINNEPAWQAF